MAQPPFAVGAHDLKGIAGPVRAWAALRPSSAEGRFEALHTSGLTDLVGREEELEFLLRRWSKAKSGDQERVPFVNPSPSLAVSDRREQLLFLKMEMFKKMNTPHYRPCLTTSPTPCNLF
jgi:hypothetical protein